MTLENLALDNLKDWEPPFNGDKYLQDFTESIDLKTKIGKQLTHMSRMERRG